MDKQFIPPEVISVSDYIADRCGITLGPEKYYLLESKLDKLLTDYPKENRKSLCARITSGQDLRLTDRIIDALTTNETFWFRDKALWQTLEEVLLPDFVDSLRSGKRHTVRIWSAACSYGQEPYSVAMCVDDYLRRQQVTDISAKRFEVLATDISNTALAVARTGLYDGVAISRGMPEAFKNRYFREENRLWQLDDTIRNMVRFEVHNLIHGATGFGRVDLLLLRNVMIYFSEMHKQVVYQNMAHALADTGILFIGSSELMDEKQSYFQREQYKEGVYYKKRRSLV